MTESTSFIILLFCIGKNTVCSLASAWYSDVFLFADWQRLLPHRDGCRRGNVHTGSWCLQTKQTLLTVYSSFRTKPYSYFWLQMSWFHICLQALPSKGCLVESLIWSTTLARYIFHMWIYNFGCKGVIQIHFFRPRLRLLVCQQISALSHLTHILLLI